MSHISPTPLANEEGDDNGSVLVTGANGFLGQALCRQLGELGHSVIGVTRHDASKLATPTQHYTTDIVAPSQWLSVDLSARKDVLTHVAETIHACNVTTVYHLAGWVDATGSILEPQRDFDHNLRATVHLLEALHAARFTGRFVFASSAAVYGKPGTLLIDEETPATPITPYGASKLAAEHYLQVYSRSYGFSAQIARIFSLYGPGQQKQVAFDLLCKLLLEQGAAVLLGDGNETRDFLYVEDAARALVLCAAHARPGGQIVNLCSGQATTIRELADMLCSLCDELPERVRFCGDHRLGDPYRWQGDNRRLLQMGFDSLTPLATGLAATVAWFRDEYLPTIDGMVYA